MDDEVDDDPFYLSRMLARLLACHTRLRSFEARDRPQILLDKERALRERYLDQVMALVPVERVEGNRVRVTMEGVLRAFRDEILIDLCRTPSGKELIGTSVSIALRSRWSEAGAYGLPPEFLADDPEHDPEQR